MLNPSFINDFFILTILESSKHSENDVINIESFL